LSSSVPKAPEQCREEHGDRGEKVFSTGGGHEVDYIGSKGAQEKSEPTKEFCVTREKEEWGGVRGAGSLYNKKTW